MELFCVVDLIVHDKRGLVLVKRKNNPFRGKWVLPGGFLDVGKETLEDCAIRELREETSLRVLKKDLELLGVYSSPKRDPRGHVISHVYVVKKFKGKLKEGSDAKNVKFSKKVPEKLGFDHKKILKNFRTSF